MADSQPAWWGALAANGLDHLSPPELELAIRELTHDRVAFLGVLGAAAGYPKESMAGWRRPDPAEIERLDLSLPPSRAVVAPEDQVAALVACALFQTTLALDPMWAAPRLFYSSWHARSELSGQHGNALLEMAAPCVRLAPFVASGALQFVPDHLPGSWEPYPMPRRAPPDASPQSRAGFAVHQAARLVYWANRLSGIAVATDRGVTQMLSQLLSSAPGGLTEASVRLVRDVDLASALECRSTVGIQEVWNDWPVVACEGSQLAALQDCLGRAAGFGRGPRRDWTLALGPPALPDVALAIRSAQSGRPIGAGHPGVPITLPRPVLALLAPDT